MLPDNYQPKIGDKLVDLTQRPPRPFIVLCSCPNSQPRRHTKRFVQNHRDMFELPKPAESQPQPQPQPPSTKPQLPENDNAST